MGGGMAWKSRVSNPHFHFFRKIISKAVISIFSFHHNVFKSLLSKGCLQKGSSFTGTRHNFFFKPLAAFLHYHRQPMVSGKRCLIPVVMTIINPRKQIVLAGDRTDDFLYSSYVHYCVNYAGFGNDKMARRKIRECDR